MTSLGIALSTAAVQVTLAALVASGVVAWAGRRSPRAAVGFAASALGLSGLLTLNAFAPVPERWRWDAAQSAEIARPVEADHYETSTGAMNTGSAFSLRRLAALLPPAGPVERSPGSPWNVWEVIAAVFLAGVAVEMVRLAAGLFGIAAIRRRSRPVDDQSLAAELHELRRSLGVRGPVKVRESNAVGTAATVGWWRPVILLAADWPTWDAGERRAVLAHELAHIRRRDYLVGVLAMLGRAAHFYHPLVRWLAGRVRLHQELAADALAAAVNGARADYLRALARMAMRQNAALVAGTARPFLSDRGSLLRRIAMLRVTDGGRPLGRARRWGLAAVLVGATLGASAVRGPAQTADAAKPVAEERAKPLPPFDLSYIPPSAAGFLAVRPAALLGRAEMKPVADEWQRLFRAACKSAGLGPAFDISLDSVEQVVGPFEIKTLTAEERKQNPHGEGHQLITGLTLIRMTHDYDWPGTLKALTPLSSVTEVKPGEFECRHPAFGRLPLTARVIDRRTIVFSLPEGRCAGSADSGGGKWGAAWKAVEGALVVEAFDNADGRWLRSLADNPTAAAALAALGRPAHVAVGIYGGESVCGKFAADYAEELTDADVARNSEVIRRILRESLDEKPKTPLPAQKAFIGMAEELFRSFTVSRSGKLVTAEARSKTKWLEILQAMTPGSEGGPNPEIGVRRGKE